VERIEELAHTADVGFRLEADSLAGLFRAAAEGLRRALGHEAAPGALETRPLRIARPDLERLLVAWLRELLAGGQVRGAVPEPLRIGVGPDEAGNPALEASIRMAPARGPGRGPRDQGRHLPRPGGRPA